MRFLRTLIAASLVTGSLLGPSVSAVSSLGLSLGGTFIDDDGHPAEPYIEAAVAAGYIGGCDASDPERFCPNSRASWSEIERGITRVRGVATRLSCLGGVCSALTVPVASVTGLLSIPQPRLPGIRWGSMPTDRATLAVLLATAARLDLPDVPERRSFTMAATGDILPHTPLMAQAARNDGAGGYDFRPMFASVEPIISAVDLGICHLETPLSSDNTALSSYPVFYSPHEVAEAVASVGYDGCSTASNHSFDKRTQGVISTLSVVEEAGLGHAGTTGDEENPAWWFYEVEGVTVAHLSYTYGLNGFRLPSDQQWLVALIDEDRILSDAAEVRSMGADFVAVSLHWGNEYQHRPSGYQRGIAETLLTSDDVDVIIGHHAHVVQAVEIINGKYVLYGLGNLVSNQFFSLPTQDGVVALLEVRETVDGFSVADIEFVPTRVERGTYRIIPIPDELSTGAPDGVRASLEESWSRTSTALSLLDESMADLVAPIR